MRRTRIGILGATVIAVSGCGGGKTFANRSHPPVPINLTVYINNARVSVSPKSFGAGPVRFIVANQASHAESLQLEAAGDTSTALADTGPINPQATAQVQVDVKQGEYTVATASGGSTAASQAAPSSIQPAHLSVGPQRPNADASLLEP
jgi:hypothetical protein